MRGYEPRPQAPHPLRPRLRLMRTPSDGEDNVEYSPRQALSQDKKKGHRNFLLRSYGSCAFNRVQATKPYGGPETMDDAGFFDLMKKQNLEADRKRRLAVEAQWKQFGEIRDKDLLLRIGYSSEEFVDELLSSHPAKKLADGVKNVNMAFDILSRSRIAFVDLAGKFHARVVHELHKDEDREPALSEATKEVYTYSCAAESLVQAYRHMISGRIKIEEKYNALRTEVFSDSKILQFIKRSSKKQ